MLTGINQWCFPEHTSLEKIFETCKKAKVDVVELNLYPSGGTGLTMDTTPAEAKAIKKMAEQYGLQLRSISSGLTGRYKLSDSDPDIRRQSCEAIQKQIELAEALEIDTILVLPGRVSEESSYDEVYERSQEGLAKMLPVAEKAGVCLAIENIWNKFLLSPLEFSRYIDELNSPAAGVYFDIGNVLLYAYPEQWIRILGSRIKRVHVKDFKSEVGNISGFSHLLSGSVNWPEVTAALREIGYTEALTAEIQPYPTAPLQAIYDTARHIEVIKGGEPR